MKQIITWILFIFVTLSACSAPQTQEPTLTPKPTWTPRPRAEFKGCAYFENEIVKGGFTFRNPNTNEMIYQWLSMGHECLVKEVKPGEYILTVHICDPEHDCGPPAGCCYIYSNGLPVILMADAVLEMDFDFFRGDFLEAYPNWDE